MKLFTRSPADPLTAKTKALSKEIARLEAEIAELAVQKPKPSRKRQASAVTRTPDADLFVRPASAVPPQEATAPIQQQQQPVVTAEPTPAVSPAAVPAAPTTSAPGPRVIPSKPRRPSAPPPEVLPVAIKTPAVSPPTATSQDPHFNDLGVRKYDLFSAWKRLTHHLSGPTSNNPRMVQYLAAGSIQGLRPLRYERRVARNRFLAFLALLILVLWGLAYWSFKR